MPSEFPIDQPDFHARFTIHDQGPPAPAKVVSAHPDVPRTWGVAAPLQAEPAPSRSLFKRAASFVGAQAMKISAVRKTAAVATGVFNGIKATGEGIVAASNTVKGVAADTVRIAKKGAIFARDTAVYVKDTAAYLYKERDNIKRGMKSDLGLIIANTAKPMGYIMAGLVGMVGGGFVTIAVGEVGRNLDAAVTDPMIYAHSADKALGGVLVGVVGFGIYKASNAVAAFGERLKRSAYPTIE